ncbi:transcription factor A, mitochondrial isoform X2 [Malurus melanocephalus]|uniref:transcription factor A, mitochondrial isoform X2 n=1 Tax=Malurus melanocephalus TaxID=175006 RepID=UPI002549A3E9|nr:transcription factor A, mitochondrial isoform X2 [Malurus melanocephalus]
MPGAHQSHSQQLSSAGHGTENSPKILWVTIKQGEVSHQLLSGQNKLNLGKSVYYQSNQSRVMRHKSLNPKTPFPLLFPGSTSLSISLLPATSSAGGQGMGAEVYEEARKTDWKRYGEQMAAYKAQLTPAQTAALKEERRKQLAKRRSMRAKRELNLLGKPKRARSGFNIFLSENFQQSEGISPVAKLKKLYDAWQKLSTSQKQPYLQLAEDDKVRYENEMKSWEAKMVELGREDLVRSRKQRLKKKPAETAKQAETAKASSGGNKAKLKLKKSEE